MDVRKTMKKLDELIFHLQCYQKTIEKNPIVSSITMDSREVTDGSLFICIKGYTVDGHKYAAAAVKAGAVAILAEKPLDVAVPVVIVKDSKRAMAIISNVFYDHPTTKLNLIGITGTNGKTTTTHLIEKVLVDQNKKNRTYRDDVYKNRGSSFRYEKYNARVNSPPTIIF